MGPRFPARLSPARPLLDDHADVPRLALTATADARTRADILAQLGIPEDGLIVAGFDRPNIRYHVRPRDGRPASSSRNCLRRSRGRRSSMRRAATRPRGSPKQIARDGRPALPYHAGLEPQVRAPQSGGVRRFRGDGDRRHRRLRHGHRQARRALRRPCRNPQSRSRPITRRPAAPGATANRPKRGCSGRARISRARGGGSRRRSSPSAGRGARAAERARRAGRNRRAAAARSCCAISARTRRSSAAIATIASTRPQPSTRPRLRANCCPPRSAPRCGSASRISPTCSPATTARKCAASAMTGCRCSASRRRRDGAGAAGRAGADRPRCAARRCLWRAVVRTRRQADPQGRGRAGDRRAAAAQAQHAASAIGGPADPLFEALREARRRARGRGRRSALCHLPRFDPARDRRSASRATSASWRKSTALAKQSLSAMARPCSPRLSRTADIQACVSATRLKRR